MAGYLGEWRAQEGMTPQEAARFRDFMKPEQAGRYSAAGVPAAAVFLFVTTEAHGRSAEPVRRAPAPSTIRRYLDVMDADRAAWWWAGGVSARDATTVWSGFDPVAEAKLLGSGLRYPVSAWVRYGFGPNEVRAWRARGVMDPAEAHAQANP